MNNTLINKIYTFLVNAPEEHINAATVIFQGIEEEPWLKSDKLKIIIEKAVNLAKPSYSEKFLHYVHLLEIFPEVCNNFHNFIRIVK